MKIIAQSRHNNYTKVFHNSVKNILVSHEKPTVSADILDLYIIFFSYYKFSITNYLFNCLIKYNLHIVMK